MHRSFTLAVAALILTSGFLIAQEPGSAPETPAPAEAQHHAHRPMPKPTNLQVLPKDTSADDVMKIMHAIEGQLGVECSYCHVKGDQPHSMNFAVDTKPEKAAARLMMRMTDDLNTRYLAKLEDHDGPPAKADCGTCHRGHAHPEAFTPPPEHHGGPGHDGPGKDAPPPQPPAGPSN